MWSEQGLFLSVIMLGIKYISNFDHISATLITFLARIVITRANYDEFDVSGQIILFCIKFPLFLLPFFFCVSCHLLFPSLLCVFLAYVLCSLVNFLNELFTVHQSLTSN